MHKTVAALKINAKGIVREEHPKALSHIQLEMTFESQDAMTEDVKRALDAAEERLCPVWSMLKGNVEISVSFSVQKSE